MNSGTIMNPQAHRIDMLICNRLYTAAQCRPVENVLIFNRCHRGQNLCSFPTRHRSAACVQWWQLFQFSDGLVLAVNTLVELEAGLCEVAG